MNNTCIRCHESHDIENFSFKDKAKNRRSNVCRECHKIYVKQHYQNNKKAYKERAVAFTKHNRLDNQNGIIEYLNTHPCTDCNEADIIVLEFDHVRGKKLGAIAELMRSWSWKRLLTEIEKCDIRCANCHRRKTSKENNYYRSQTNLQSV